LYRILFEDGPDKSKDAVLNAGIVGLHSWSSARGRSRKARRGNSTIASSSSNYRRLEKPLQQFDASRASVLNANEDC
jgi:hypothetical protein